MRAWTRGLLAVALAVTGLTAIAPPGAAAATTTTLEVDGTLRAWTSDPDGRTDYALERSDGTMLSLRMPAGSRTRTPVRWSGRIAVPASVAGRFGLAGTSNQLDASRGTGKAVVAELVRRGTTARVLAVDEVPGAAATVAPTPTTHHWYVLVPTIGGAAASDADALGLASTVANYWGDQANGKISGVTVEPAVVHYTSSAGTVDDCGLVSAEYTAMRTEARQQVPGIDLDAGDQILLVVPTDQCDAGGTVGRGDVGMSFASGGFTIIQDDPELRVTTAAHEVGHNYGFQHAGLFTCAIAVTTCLDEYGGIYDVMGYAVRDASGLPALNTAYRVMNGITDPGEVIAADFSSPFTRTWTIQPRSDDSGARSIHLVDPDTSEDFWLDYRSGTGQDADAAYAPGIDLCLATLGCGAAFHYGPGVVMERRLTGAYADHTAVLPGHLRSAALEAGDSWTNDSGSLTVAIDSITAGGAQVTVNYAPTGTDPGPGTVSLSGDPTLGGYVNADTDGWDGAWLSYTWVRDGAEVPSADDIPQYYPVLEDVGHQISVRVRGNFPDGGWVHTVTSAPVTITPAEFAIDAVPAISGSPKVGSRLSAIGGAWEPTYATVEWHWEWQADSSTIVGAPASSFFTPTARELGTLVRACQRLTADGYVPTTICSAALGPVAAGTIVPAAPAAPGLLSGSKPRIKGKAKVGRKLKVKVGSWTPGTHLSYRWFANRKAIKRATRPKLKLTKAVKGKRITVRVTGRKSGYLTLVKVSKATRKVRR